MNPSAQSTPSASQLPAAASRAADRSAVLCIGEYGADDAAAAWAVEYASAHDQTLTLVHVIDPQTNDDAHPATQAEVGAATELLETTADHIRFTNRALDIVVHVSNGNVHDEILRLSAPETLLVFGAPAGPGGSRARNSLGITLASTAYGPVAVIPAPDAQARQGVMAAVDGTETAMTAALFAASEAALLGLELRVISVWREPPIWQETFIDSRTRNELERGNRAVLNAAVDRLRLAFPSLAVTGLLCHADTVEALVSEAQSASLLVVGSRQNHGLRRLLLGSTSHGILTSLPAPTIVVGNVT
ncbi:MULTISPECIES: universal stress protein [Subtercola]|nr:MULTISPECIES: universal stress protein [Subtercola]MEA9983819.1 universal stress protein [Subtercola sp. RTI3]